MLACKQKRMNLQYKHQGGMNTQTPKEVPTTQHRKDTQLSREMGNRHFREETTSAKEDTGETENLDRALTDQCCHKCRAEAKWNPHQASETQQGWETALPMAKSTCLYM